MSHAIIFDTHDYIKKLKAVNFSEQQAEVQAEALKELIENNLATKRDLEDLKKDMLLKIGAMFGTSIGILSILITVLNRTH